MGKSQKKRLLAASERFRRNYACCFYGQKIFPDGVTHIFGSIRPRIFNYKKSVKEHGSK